MDNLLKIIPKRLKRNITFLLDNELRGEPNPQTIELRIVCDLLLFCSEKYH